MRGDLFDGDGIPVPVAGVAGIRLRRTTAPGAATDGGGNVDIVAVDGGGGLVHRRYLGDVSASMYTRIGREPVFAGTPLVLRAVDGRVHVLCRDIGGRVRHSVQTGHAATTWSPWRTLDHDGAVHTDPCGVVGSGGDIDIFATDVAGHAVRTRLEPAGDRWSRWSSLDAPPVRGGLSAARTDDGTIHLVCAGSDGCLHHHVTGHAGPRAGARPWRRLAAHVTGAPTVLAGHDDRVTVTARGDDGRPRYAWRDPDDRWTEFHALPGAPVIPGDARVTGAPERHQNTVALFVRTTRGEVLRSLVGVGHEAEPRPWRTVATGVASDAVAVTGHDGRVQLFAVGCDADLIRIIPHRPDLSDATPHSPAS